MSIPPVQPGLSYAATGPRAEPTAVAGNGNGVASAVATPAVAAPTPPGDPQAAAIAQALGAAAGRQNGLAPLLANLEALQARPDVPAAVSNAAQSLLNMRLSDTTLNGDTLRQAVSQSGLFVEAAQAQGLTPGANIKSALQNLRTALQGLTGVDGAAAAPSVTASSAAGLATDAATKQAALAVLSDAETALAGTGGPVALGALRATSATNLETLLARPALPVAVFNAAQAVLGALASNAAMSDAAVKVAVQSLRDVLKGALGASSAASDNRTAPLPPPFRGALPVAQPPVSTTIAGAGLQQAASTVLQQTDAAIARHVMLQIASLPAAQQPAHPLDDHTQRLVLDIPLMTPQGTTVVQLQIERDAPEREVKAPVWSVRFAVDMDPLGPVRARVAQIDGKTSVTMVAEKPASAAALQSDLGALRTSLAQASLDPGELHCLNHDQTKVTAPQGQFVNRAS